MLKYGQVFAEVAELAYAHGLGPCGETHAGSTPVLGSAGVAQLVEHYLAKVDVEGSSPFSRSYFF